MKSTIMKGKQTKAQVQRRSSTRETSTATNKKQKRWNMTKFFGKVRREGWVQSFTEVCADGEPSNAFPSEPNPILTETESAFKHL